MTAKLSGNVSGTQVQWQQAISKVLAQARPSAPAQVASKPLADTFQAKKPSPKVGAPPSSQQQARDSFKSVVNGAINATNEQRNLLSQHNRQQGGWKSIAPVLQQTSETDCGAAAAAMLLRAKGSKEGVSDAQLVKDLGSVYSTKEGTTPKQLSKMLAHEGIQVKQGTSQLDKGALDGTLTSGGKAVAMVDSNKIAPGGEAKPAGKAHWVVIDGMDDKGQYMVKDPSNASSYFVKPETLAKAVDSTRATNQAGGMLLVENARTPVPAAALVEEGTKKAEALGDKPGTGSNTRRFGRESS
ncbi:cysteine peptidase family C39 domain-containing protein [Archangium sp.]|uniref:cysteine peptidase family C39 domain-containing protein n=1 Tax=Archangium sp. TaxID=1872627 RepID=UPI00286D4061|nr:cysteine peptidase family C39 domain-containing protein [Archangium sp.]